MSAPRIPVLAPLPKSHYFFTVSRGTGMRTFAVRVALVQIIACVLPLLALTGAGSTAYLVFHDDIIASLMAHQGEMQYAYEDKLDAMRGELQREAVRDTTDRAAIEARLHELTSREGKLEDRTALVASLADLMGVTPARRSLPAGQASVTISDIPNPPTLPPEPQEGAGLAFPPPFSPASPAALKPHPVADQEQPMRPAAAAAKTVSMRDPVGLPLATTLALASGALDKVEQAQLGALRKIGSAARGEASRLEATLEEVGLTSDRFRRDTAADQGGPFVPLPDDKDSVFGKTMLDLQDTISTAARLKNALTRVPLADPLPGMPEITSPFGARLDPFLGRPALHTGVDLREASGTDVKATAAGRVAFASTAGGYGNMVEIDHGNGLVTRYAHMEEIRVADGQTVEKDAIVGRVGSTGRATGPHLHYEIRVDNEPVDPMRFLNVGLQAAGLPLR